VMNGGTGAHIMERTNLDTHVSEDLQSRFPSI